MHGTNPRALTQSEWVEVHQQPEVRSLWGIEKSETVDSFRESVFAVHFDFVSGSPGYVGDLYLIQGDYLGDVPPVALVRDDHGSLRVHPWSELVSS